MKDSSTNELEANYTLRMVDMLIWPSNGPPHSNVIILQQRVLTTVITGGKQLLLFKTYNNFYMYSGAMLRGLLSKSMSVDISIISPTLLNVLLCAATMLLRKRVQF
jgi:hypothetical protein